MSIVHVRQIETRVRELYEDEDWHEELDETNNLSRLLGKYAVTVVMPTDGAGTIIEITDGEDDRGIDAVGVDPTASRVVVVQSKWRQDGRGSIDQAATLKFVDGVRALLDLESEAPAECSEATHEAVRRVMAGYGARLELVLATTAQEDLTDPVRQPLDRLMAMLNDVPGQDVAGLTVLKQGELFETLANEPRQAVTLEVQLLEWGRVVDPRTSYYGRVNAQEVASWFVEHGHNLFAENLRVVLPNSEINEGIRHTAIESPEEFWYFNNGITILASDIERQMAGALAREAMTFRLNDASIINGAQTVSTLGRALADGHDDELQRAHVHVRCIEIPAGDEALARRVTRFANTQNVVTTQDFVFLDDEQHRLRKELNVLDYEYLLRSGEVPVTDDKSKVIPVREAAVALACAADDVAPAVIAKREVSRLFSRDGGPYDRLFNPRTDPLLLSRAVIVVRRVNGILEDIQRDHDGIKAGVAVHGRTVIAHLVLNRIGRGALENPDLDIESELEDLTDECMGYVDAMTSVFPDNSYPGNVFKNQGRVGDLLDSADVT